MKVGIFYSFNTGKTRSVGERILKEFGSSAESIDIEDVGVSKFFEYDLIIIGASTWYDGKLPDYWDDILPDLENADFKNTNVAIFGLGNQQAYPDYFGDSIFALAEVLEPLGAKLLGFTSTDGYTFNASKSVRDGKFMGLLIDEESQPELTKERISNWVKQLKKSL